ncbi:MAG: hypothetical protein Q7U73_05015 [Rubrivivax sp.]|nr:hypothetical protein [Rubrivivax sp.]
MLACTFTSARADLGDAAKVVGAVLSIYGAVTGNPLLIKWGAALTVSGPAHAGAAAARRLRRRTKRQGATATGHGPAA